MANQQLVDYIQSNLQRGDSLQQIKQSLLAQGWSDHNINDAINLAQGQSINKSSKKLLRIIPIVIVIVIAGIFTFFMFEEKEKLESYQFLINLPRETNIKLNELTALSLFEEQPISKSGGFSLNSSNLNSMRQVIMITDEENNTILMAYIFPRKNIPTTLTTKQKNTIEQYLYPNREPIIVDSKSTSLALLMMNPFLMGTSETQKLLVAIDLLERDEFSLFVSKVEQALVKSPKGYLKENSEVYTEAGKIITKMIEAPEQPEEEGVTYYDCGSSDSCFSNHVKTCSPAKAKISQAGAVYEEKVRGFENNNCIISIKYLSGPMGIAGKEISCKVPKKNLDNFKDYLQGERIKQSCEGTLLDFLS